MPCKKSTIPPFPNHIREKRLQWVGFEIISGEFLKMKNMQLLPEQPSIPEIVSHSRESYKHLVLGGFSCKRKHEAVLGNVSSRT